MLFPVGINQSYAQSNIANMINDPDLPAPTAPDFTVYISRANPSEVIIPFSDEVPAVSGNTFEQLTVTLSLTTNTQGLFSSFNTFMGTNQTTLDTADDVLEVTENTVTVNTIFGGGTNFDFDYTVTNTNGVSDSGVITIAFVDIVMANPYTVTLTGTELSGPRPIPLAISQNQINDILLDGTVSSSAGSGGFTYTTNGTVDDAGVVSTGNASGTLTVTNPSISAGGSLFPVFHYTPVPGFVGIEAFDYTVTSFTISDTSQLYIVVPVPPVELAPDHTVEVLTGSANTLIIPFSEFINIPSGNTFAGSTITFALQDAFYFSSFDGITGIEGDEDDGDPQFPSAGDTLTVNAETVLIDTIFGDSFGLDLLFDYTVTLADGTTDSGVITYTFVTIIVDPTANEYTIILPDLFGLPTFDIPFTSEIRNALLAGSTLGSTSPGDIVFTTTGTGDGTVTESDGTIVAAPGTLSFAPGNSPLIKYTPASDFFGTETFPYTVNVGSKPASSTISFTVPTVVCTTTMVNDMNFGELQEGQTYENDGSSFMNITSTANIGLQPTLRSENWKSVADSSETVMNVGQTRYFATNANYLDSTPFTNTGAIYGSELGDGEKVRVYQSLNIDLIDKSFEGSITQEWRVGGDCSD